MQNKQIAKIVLGVLVVLFSIVGCEKEDSQELSYPYSLVLKDYKLTSEVKLFSKFGEIKNKFVIQHYFAQDKYRNHYFYSNVDTIFKLEYADTLTYKSPDTLLFPEPGLWGKRIFKKVDDYMFFYLTDTLNGAMGSGVRNIDFENVIQNICLYKFYLKNTAFPSYNGGISASRVYDARIAKGTPYRLEFPSLSYTVTHRPLGRSYASSAGYSNINNIFDSNVLKLLKDGDTLAVQTSLKTYVKIN
jgi:hypothetical protein